MMVVVRATLAGFPTASMDWFMALRSGLKRVATTAITCEAILETTLNHSHGNLPAWYTDCLGELPQPAAGVRAKVEDCCEIIEG